MLTLKTLYNEIINNLKKNNIDSADIEARLILAERTNYNWSDIIAYSDAVISKEEQKEIICDVKERIAGKPLSRIYGVREFWGLNFQISEDTLDPRPDTEAIIERALEHFPKKYEKLRFLDLGTGSGCILIALLSEFKNALGVGVDLSEKALHQAKINAQNNDCNNRINLFCSNWLDKVSGRFDLIVSNPPYISNQIIQTLSKEVRNHDPILSLDGGYDGLNPYKIIFPQLKNYLNLHGIALFEIGYDQEKTVMRLAEESGFRDITIHSDLAGNPRVVDISSGDK